MLGRGLPKGWVVVVLLNRGLKSGGKDSWSQPAEGGGKLPVECPAWGDPAEKSSHVGCTLPFFP